MAETGRTQQRDQGEKEKSKPAQQTNTSELAASLSSPDHVTATPRSSLCDLPSEEVDGSAPSNTSDMSVITSVHSLFAEEGENPIPLAEKEQGLAKDLVVDVLSRSLEEVTLEERTKEPCKSNVSVGVSFGDVSSGLTSPGLSEQDQMKSPASPQSPSLAPALEQRTEKTDKKLATMSHLFYQRFSAIVSRVKLSHTPHFSLDDRHKLARFKVGLSCTRVHVAVIVQYVSFPAMRPFCCRFVSLFLSFSLSLSLCLCLSSPSLLDPIICKSNMARASGSDNGKCLGKSSMSVDFKICLLMEMPVNVHFHCSVC